MRTCLTRTLMLVSVSLMLSATAIADDGSGGWGHRPSLRGPIFDITHFDVIPLTSDSADFLQTAYAALFIYRDASRADRGLQSFRVVNWLLASNHSQIIDVWSGLEAFEQHLAVHLRHLLLFSARGKFSLDVETQIVEPRRSEGLLVSDPERPRQEEPQGHIAALDSARIVRSRPTLTPAPGERRALYPRLHGNGFE